MESNLGQTRHMIEMFRWPARKEEEVEAPSPAGGPRKQAGGRAREARAIGVHRPLRSDGL